ncbi:MULTISPECIES: TetR/AcrR family transcriptional regulator [unclassified Brevibacterium]|uniref:TetR/AcrR family transcriptional regulator n=1 Tax=unclassified Brevibacterium TaxID=2614124 RepID=UPI001E56D704|nr:MULTISPECIES: TetR/AcrR family transcriptional regulator [unclassified Brevibacterium]MCD1285995.1 TetR/AcrR family transcriptional regulator [Brevibacterium sp. CCUG 69071]MDK8435061.1 TetR/AcrR family transcriptional regulator [Brevibacterium sp. H-BE7]
MENTTPRQRARLETEAQITRIGNRMVDEDGVDGLSLRAVARELGVVSSAVYRYVKSRDELLTILIRDAFTQIAEEVDAALAEDRSVPSLALSMLDWSRRYPNRWALIYGTPVPDYEAPRQETVVPGTRVMVALTQLIAEASTPPMATSAPSSAEPSRTAQALGPLREGLEELGIDADDAVIMRTLTVWVAIIGAVNGLRFGQFGPGFDDVEADLVRALIADLGA